MARISWVFTVGLIGVIIALWVFASPGYVANVAVLSGAGNAAAVLKTIGMDRTLGDLTWIIASFAHGFEMSLPATGLGAALAFGLFRHAVKIEDGDVASRSSNVVDRLGTGHSGYVGATLVFHGITTALDLSDQSLRLKRAAVKIAKAPWLTPFENEAISILAAHKKWPADVDGYHHETLMKHSIAVWKHAAKVVKANQYEQESETAAIARSLAIMHDIGKILAYQEKDGRWTKTSNKHEQLGLLVMRSMDSFWGMRLESRKKLEKAAAILLNGDTPVETGAIVDFAVKAVQTADMSVTAEELGRRKTRPGNDAGTRAAIAATSDAATIEMGAIDRQIVAAVFHANKEAIIGELQVGKKSGSKKAIINSKYNDMVFIDASTFSNSMISALEENGITGLDRPRGNALTSDAKMILKTLAADGSIITCIGTEESGDLGTFSVTIPKNRIFSAVCLEWKWPDYLVAQTDEFNVECSIRHT
jgi:hypothetical protein